MLNEFLQDLSSKAPFQSFPLHVGGYVLLAIGIAMAFCFGIMGCPDGTAVAIGGSSAALIVIGLVLLAAFRTPNKVIPLKGIATVSLVLLLACVSGAIPYLAYGLAPMDAVFESVSGFTTTGITCIEDLESMPGSMLLWRSLTGWLGGIGFICVFTLFLTVFGLGGRYLFSSDLLSESRIFTNRMKTLAVRFAALYAAITLVEAVILTALGNSFLDSVCLSMSTASTTGFAVADDEVVSLDMASKAVIAVFMVIASTNLITTFTAVTKRSLQPFREDSELRYMLVWFAVVIVLLVILLSRAGYSFDSFDSFFDTLFYALSVATTTGFVAGYVNWPETAVIFLSIVGLIGGCSNSATGGLKIHRLKLIAQVILGTVRLSTSPNAVYSIKDHGKDADSNVVYSSIIIAVLFLIIAAIGAGAISLLTNTMDFSSSIALSIASLSTVGSGLFELTAIELGPWIQLVLCLLMWIGRLEVIMAVLVLTPGFWKAWMMSGIRRIRNP